MSEKKTWQASIRIDGIFTFDSDVNFDELDQREADDMILDIFWHEQGENQLDFEVEDLWSVGSPSVEEVEK